MSTDRIAELIVAYRAAVAHEKAIEHEQREASARLRDLLNACTEATTETYRIQSLLLQAISDGASS